MGSGGIETKAAPRLGYDDAVAGIAGIEADLDGQVDADVADVIAERGDVLSALVGDAGDAIAIDEDAGGGGGWALGGGVAEPVGLGDAAVRYATDLCKVVAADTLDLRWRGSSTGEYVGGDARDGGCAETDGDQIPRVTEQHGQKNWDLYEHGGLDKRIAYLGQGGDGVRGMFPEGKQTLDRR